MSGEVGVRGKGLMDVIALHLLVAVTVGTAVQLLLEMLEDAVKLMGGALRIVQEVGVWLVYL